MTAEALMVMAAGAALIGAGIMVGVIAAILILAGRG